MKDGLDFNLKQEFAKNSIPAIDKVGNALLDRLHEDTPRPKNPSPSLAYGLATSAWLEVQSLTLEQLGCNLSFSILCPFFIIEAIAMGDSIGQALNQLRGGGAAVVNNARHLNAVAAGTKGYPKIFSGQPSTAHVSYPRADHESFMFGLVVHPVIAIMLVH